MGGCLSSFQTNSELDNPNFPITLQYGIRRFTLKELSTATGNFNESFVLGEGSFGKVYIGQLDDWLESSSDQKLKLAIKRLNTGSFQGFKEWLVEVVLLARLKHPNLVRLLGFCQDNKGVEALLVYEFMANGSLDYHLFGKESSTCLSWDKRCRIAWQTASALSFLHEHGVIHRDVKASNVLLDEDFNARITDFGLAVGAPSDQTHVTTNVKGTYGYLDPKYAESGHLTPKSDVYSFGVMLLELLTGRKAAFHLDKTLTAWIRPHLLERHLNLNIIVDPNLENRYSQRSASTMAKLAKHCIEINPEFRPEMKDLVEALKPNSIQGEELKAIEEAEQ